MKGYRKPRKEEKVKTRRWYLRKRRGVLCVDVVAECDRYVGETWLPEPLMREGGGELGGGWVGRLFFFPYT